jgi:hypothetical protein
MRSSYYDKGQFPAAKTKVPQLLDESQKITIKFSIEESLLAKIKQFHIQPAEICVRELRREVRRRQRAVALRAERQRKRQIVNRYSGEVLSTS